MFKKILVSIIILLVIPNKIYALSDSARSSILIDTDSNRILYSKNMKELRSVASISKIMTAIITIESNKLKNIVTIDESILKAYGSGIYVKVGEKLTLEELLYGLMLRSGNDAALAIANYVGGSKTKFVSLMNKKAVKLGMKNSVFNNPSGLDEEKEKGNFSTAYDMAILTSYAMQNPVFKKIVSTKKYVLKTNKNVYVWHNKNKLLNSYENATGGKTGFTKKARRTLVSTASKNNLNLAVVTLNDGNDFADHKNIHEYGFENFKKHIFIKKGILKIPGEKFYKHNMLTIKNDLSVALTDDEKTNVKIKYKLDKKRKLKNNEVVGSVQLLIDDKIITKENIIYISKKDKQKTKGFLNWVKNLW